MIDELVQHKQKSFLETFAKIGNVTKAAQAVGFARSMHYYWAENDPEYARAFEESLTTFKDSLHFEAFRRGMVGIDEPVVYQGQISIGPNGSPVTVKKYSDTMLIVLMKKHGVFVERQEHSGPEGGPIPHQGAFIVVGGTEASYIAGLRQARAALQEGPLDPPDSWREG